MLEWLAIPAAIGVAAFIPKKPMSDEKKIERIFENTETCVGSEDSKKYPKLKRKYDKGNYTTYLYSLPLGLSESDIEGILPALQDGLNKEVEMELDGLLKLSVYSTKLTNWNYDTSLLRPGTWEVPIGMSHQGILYHDFDKYPHFIIGGVTRFGKTVLLKGMFNTLLLNNPDDVEFYILDLKGGLEFYKYSGIPQVKRVACDIYESAEILNELSEEIKQQEALLRKHGYSNIVDSPIKKRKFIIVDEGSELAPEFVTKDKKKYAEFCQSVLSEISRISGGLGMRLIYCTQYPSKQSIHMSIKSNVVAKVSFIAANQYASQTILNDTSAMDLPPIPGRAIYLIEKKRTVQVPYIDDKMMFKMMEERKDELTNRKPVNDYRQTGNGENQTPTKNP